MEPSRITSSPVGRLATLSNNSFLFAPVFESFYEALGSKERSLLLAYLVLPLVLPPRSQALLVGRSRKRHFRTFVEDPSLFAGLPSRIANRRHQTNLSIQHNLNLGVLEIQDSTSVVRKNKGPKAEYCPPRLSEAAANLGKLCSSHSVPTIYLQLGIKRL